jgi:type III secretion protein Q
MMWVPDDTHTGAMALSSQQPLPLILPLVTHDEAEWLNRLYRPRQAWQGVLMGKRVSIRLAWRDETCQETVTAPLSISGQAACLHLPLALLTTLIDLSPAMLQAPALLRALLLEQTLLPCIRPLEQASGLDVQFIADPVDVSRTIRVQFQLTLADECHPVSLDLSPSSAVSLMPLLERAFASCDAPMNPLMLTLALGVGRQQLRLGEIQSLEPGDVVMLRSSHDTWLSLGEHIKAEVTPVTDGYRLHSGLFLKKEWDMSDTSTDTPRPAEQDPLQEVPVTLVCEAGRLDMPLGELKALAEGSVLAFPHSSDEAVDLIVNGRKIGRGTLVRIGEGLGVRITSLSTHG